MTARGPAGGRSRARVFALARSERWCARLRPCLDECMHPCWCARARLGGIVAPSTVPRRQSEGAHAYAHASLLACTCACSHASAHSRALFARPMGAGRRGGGSSPRCLPNNMIAPEVWDYQRVPRARARVRRRMQGRGPAKHAARLRMSLSGHALCPFTRLHLPPLRPELLHQHVQHTSMFARLERGVIGPGSRPRHNLPAHIDPAPQTGSARPSQARPSMSRPVRTPGGALAGCRRGAVSARFGLV